MRIQILSIFAATIFFSCSGSKNIVESPMVEASPEVEERTLDTTYVVAPKIEDMVEEEVIPTSLPRYNPSYTRTFDLKHTSLDLKFNWEKQHVIGKARLNLSVIFYPQSTLELDAKGMDINYIRVGGKDVKFDNNGSKLLINLGRTFKKGESLSLEIDYVAKPNEGPEGGSAAITSDKGLFFINPTGEDPDKPTQIWTQGETEHNSRWFPTIDKPNERMTQEIKLTVEDKYQTLSNGTLTSSRKNPDGTRTDTWIQKLPDAPYLTMIAIGEYAVVKERWKDIELSYYVEKEYKPYAKLIFEHTPEMMDFFSDKLSYPYPWDKYAQIISKDYVSGAMENTGAVIFGDFVQKNDRELIDNDNDYIVAHELMHHWFGDLVTVESWANLTLQEGFANYAEYLWMEYKDGITRADAHRMDEITGYLQNVANTGHKPLIRYGYNDKEEVFDAHSYNKGGLVLHMLRSIVGDDAFYASLNKYLRDNEYTAVEVDELRMAFEDVTGMDLNWFFDQWYLNSGHPQLNINHEYNDSTRVLSIMVDQVQSTDGSLPVYKLISEVAVYDDNGVISYYPVTIENRNTDLVIEDINRPAAVVFDGKNDLLAEINETQSPEEYAVIYKYSPNLQDRRLALQNIARTKYFTEVKDFMLKDSDHEIQAVGIDLMDNIPSPEKITMLKSLVFSDKHSIVRAAALEKLAEYDFAVAKPIVEKLITGKDAYIMTSSALKILSNSAPEKALVEANKLAVSDIGDVVVAVGSVYADSGDPQYLPYFMDKFSTISLYSMNALTQEYLRLLTQQDLDTQYKAIDQLKERALNDENLYRRYFAAVAINGLEDGFLMNEDNISRDRARKALDVIIDNEKEQTLLSQYQTF